MKLLSAPEVAKLLRVSPCTIRMNAAKGRLGFRTVKVGSLWKFPENEVMEYIYGKNYQEHQKQTEINEVAEANIGTEG